MSDKTAKAAPSAAHGEADLVIATRPADGVLLLTLDAPASRNALSLSMMTALTDAIAAVGHAPELHALVLAANGPAFCAGHDLKELTAHRGDDDKGTAFYRQTMESCSALMQSIVRLPKPVIAAVEGIATAAGCQLVASTDLAIAGKAARFCTPGVNIGLFCSTPMVALSRNVSRKKAMEMLLLGDFIAADEAAEFGLVNDVVAEGKAVEIAVAWASRIASKSPATVSTGKRTFYEQLEMPLEDAYRFASEVMVQNMLKADAEEGISAFLERRTPKWQGC